MKGQITKEYRIWRVWHLYFTRNNSMLNMMSSNLIWVGALGNQLTSKKIPSARTSYYTIRVYELLLFYKLLWSYYVINVYNYLESKKHANICARKRANNPICNTLKHIRSIIWISVIPTEILLIRRSDFIQSITQIIGNSPFSQLNRLVDTQHMQV